MRIAILDLGTNTFHLLIVDQKGDGSVKKLFKSKLSVKLGEGAIHKDYIAEKAFERGINALMHYSDVISKYRAERIFAFATSAIRSAKNSKEFVKSSKERAGIIIKTITGDEEAELICYGVRQCVQLKDEPVLIMDIGGGSTEFIIADKDKIFWKKSFNIGASRLLEMFHPSDPIKKSELNEIENFFDRALIPLDDALKKYPVKKLIGSSGSFDTYAEMIGWRFHGYNVIGGKDSYQYNLEEYFQLHGLLLKSTAQIRKQMKGLIKMRVDMIVLASICTKYVLRKYKMKEMILSKYALKEGALWKILNES